MITFRRITDTSEPIYRWIEALLTEAFPEEERRDNNKQSELINTREDFHCNLLEEDGVAVGLMNYWALNGFVFLEHFAVDSSKRNGGFGQKALNTLKEEVHFPIILEAEEPHDDLSKRRIGFYERQGFELLDIEYFQPPYRKEDGYLPLKLMTFGDLHMDTHHQDVIDEIYQKVYDIHKE